mmetsp:Transcript_19563/g.42445  ORF Transcript_19563/g.42445 Transcript_19563/m.42445 type:complete len:788 (+) Transcript_19563:181-2544(+)
MSWIIWPLALLVLAASYVNAGPIQSSSGDRPRRSFVLTIDTPPAARCVSTLGTWCKEYHHQQAVPWKPAPRGSKACPSGCNGVGSCNYDLGICQCPAGWKGDDCKTVQKRPCTNRNRHPDDMSDEPLGHIDEHGKDINWLEGGGTQSRCGGICDDDIAMCWCDGPKGRVNAPKDSPPGTPPVRVGRPMTTPMCQPRTTKEGKPTHWGDQPYDNLYGKNGWCVADQPAWRCPCIIDGLDGPNCEDPVEHFCVNQCSGHGLCYLGFCKCDEGWYGTDCSRKKAGGQLEPSRIPQHKWLDYNVREPPAALDPPPKPARKRPLIYVYDLEPLYSQKLLQYRIPSSWCVHRRFERGNVTLFTDLWVYAVDTLLHEMLVQSEHRTYDPEEADFFYVPQYASCYPFPIMSWADYPWFHAPGLDRRVMHASNIVLDSKRWVEQHFPYWKKRGGKDHIFLFTHDEGACWAPNEVLPAIWLTHWGRLGLNHTSNSAFGPDNYNVDHKTKRTPEGWLKGIEGHACYEPGKDLVLPSFKSQRHYHKSPLMGNPAKHRDILLFFKGDVGRRRMPNYSRGVRQTLHRLSIEKGWREKHNVVIGDSQDVHGDYTDLLSRSKYCLVAPGDGWSGRAEDAILHGCVPVVIMDGVHVVWESILDWSSFSVRIPEKDIERTLEILLAIPERKLRSLQVHLSRVWHRFRYHSGAALENIGKEKLASNLVETEKQRVQQAQADQLQHVQEEMESAAGPGGGNGSSAHMQRLINHPHANLPRPFRGDPTIDDAFSTLMQWLYSRIPATQ